MRHTLRMAAIAATALLSIGLAADPGHAQDDDQPGQVGLLNLNNSDIIHNVAVCVSTDGAPTVVGIKLPSLNLNLSAEGYDKECNE